MIAGRGGTDSARARAICGQRFFTGMLQFCEQPVGFYEATYKRSHDGVVMSRQTGTQRGAGKPSVGLSEAFRCRRNGW